jgi:hypothetical protein
LFFLFWRFSFLFFHSTGIHILHTFWNLLGLLFFCFHIGNIVLFESSISSASHFEGEKAKLGLPSLLFLSPARSSRLMTLCFVTAGAVDGFSAGILFSTHVLSPHPSIIYSALSKINLL